MFGIFPTWLLFSLIFETDASVIHLEFFQLANSSPNDGLKHQFKISGKNNSHAGKRSNVNYHLKQCALAQVRVKVTKTWEPIIQVVAKMRILGGDDSGPYEESTDGDGNGASNNSVVTQMDRVRTDSNGWLYGVGLNNWFWNYVNSSFP